MSHELLLEPCPDHILYYTGSMFAMGALGGTAFHFPKGIYNSPSGARLRGGAKAVRMNAPRVAGRFALWGGLYSTFKCALGHARQKDDPWNSILAGAAAGGLVSMRKGFGPMAGTAMGCAALFAFMDGMDITFERFSHLSGQKDQPRK